MSAIQSEDVLDRRLRQFLDLRAEEVARVSAPAAVITGRLAVHPRSAQRQTVLRIALVGGLVVLAALAVTLLLAASRHQAVPGSWALPRGATWSPDGRKVAFVAVAREPWTASSTGSPSPGPSAESASNDIYVVNADGSGLRLLGTRPIQSLDDLIGGPHLLWSADGRYLAYGRHSEAPAERVEIIDTTTGNDTTPAVGTDSAWPVGWSPSTDRLLFIRSGPWGNDLYTVGPDGGDLVALTSDHVSSAGSWSPDGTRISFVNPVVNGTQADGAGTWVMAADGTGKTQIGSCCDAGWSADGRAVYVDNDGAELTPIPLDGGPAPARPVTLGHVNGWLLGPDGSTVATASDSGIVVQRVDGSVHQVTNDGDDRLVAFSPDGRFLAFIGARSGDAGLFTIPVDGGRPVPIGPEAVSPGNPWRPGVGGPDRILFEREGDLYTSAADGSGDQRLTTRSTADSQTAAVGAPSSSARMVIGPAGPDHDRYRITRGTRYQLTFQNTTGQAWVIGFPGMTPQRLDCRPVARDLVRLVVFDGSEPASASPPDAFPDVCATPAFGTVSIDLPVPASGSTTLVVSRLGPGDQPTLPGYLVTVEFVDPVASPGS